MTPVYKKAESHNPFNHRSITVIHVFKKLSGSHNLYQSTPILIPTQSKPQRGFTIDTPPLLTGLLIQEVISTTKSPVYLCMLDVKTAFDTVWHEALLRQIFLDDIDGSYGGHTVTYTVSLLAKSDGVTVYQTFFQYYKE